MYHKRITIPLQKNPSVLKSSRIKFLKEEEGNVLEIHAFYEEAKQKVLLVWLTAFTLCGLAIISQLFFEVNSELRLMILVFAFFWLYFEYKIVRAYRWRKNGVEKFLFKEDTLYYGRLVNNRGFLKPYRRDLLGEIRKVEIPENNFFASMNDSYWVVAGETLAFTYGGQLIPFGLRLTKGEANHVIKKIGAYFKDEA